MPAGYASALSAMLAETLAPVMGGLTPAIARAASMARSRLTAQKRGACDHQWQPPSRQHPERVELMAGAREIRCVGPSAYLPDRKAAIQRTVNMYLRQITGLGEDKQLILSGCPGLVLRHQFAGQVRGVYATESREFVVAGNTLYETTGQLAGSPRIH